MAEWSDHIRRILANRTRLEVASDAEDPPLIRAAVLVPLYEVGGQIYVLLTRRTDKVDHHKGQVSFPGGRCDEADRDALDTALREAYEEVGLRREDVEVLGALDDMLTTTGFVVTPYVGVIPYPYELSLNEHEVAAALHVPLTIFSHPTHYREEVWERNGRPVTVQFYQHNEDVIWGATARMIKSFLELSETLSARPSPAIRPGREEYIQTPDVRLRSVAWGAPDRPSLTLLHGSLQTAYSWEDFAMAAQDRYHLRALDQRGHGDSAWAARYAPKDYVRDLEFCLSVWGGDPTVLLGMSMGGIHALLYADRHPGAVRALVLIDVGAELNPEGVRSVRRFLVSAPDDFASIEEAVALASVYNPRRSPENLRRRLSHNLRQGPGGRWVWKYDRRFKTMGSVYSHPLPDLWAVWDRITCPVLIVRGQESNVLAEQVARQMTERRPQAVLAEVTGAGHSVVGDNLEGFRGVLEPFLAGL